jgi:formate hydrogenlyase transcriptional activator
LKKSLSFSHVQIGLLNEDKTTYSAFLLDPQSPCLPNPEYMTVIQNRYPINDGIMDHVLMSPEPESFDVDMLVMRDHPPRYVTINFEFGIRKIIYCLLKEGEIKRGALMILSPERRLPDPSALRLIKGISGQLSVAISRIEASLRIDSQMEEITQYKQKLEEEKSYLQEEIKTANNYNEIIGTGEAMRKIFGFVSKVAESDSSVLIMGETGTGKELVARALHNSSLRRDKMMVKVNCASIPANLIESELFGHERGSFTGATERRIGKFELADKSTLFLDEIGELPFDLQSKLLRALQEMEIERVGGRGVINVNVRVIAATNRDLSKEIKTGTFRTDLYYRINVFPLVIPPLRERRDDIPTLAAHFLYKYAKRSNKVVMNFSQRVMKQMIAYDWPGNVRELEHLVERSVLLTPGPTINQLFLSLSGDGEEQIDPAPGNQVKTIDEVEREHIVAVLKLCGGKVSGPGGAAEKLRIPSTTLSSKIGRLGIKKGYTEK